MEIRRVNKKIAERGNFEDRYFILFFQIDSFEQKDVPKVWTPLKRKSNNCCLVSIKVSANLRSQRFIMQFVTLDSTLLQILSFWDLR